MLMRYAVTHWMQMAQTAACNRLHNIEQRFARWLLITQDRVDSPRFFITQDFLATMLGTDRPTHGKLGSRTVAEKGGYRVDP
jgi:hypothetical protein